MIGSSAGIIIHQVTLVCCAGRFDWNKSYGFIECADIKETYGCDVWVHWLDLSLLFPTCCGLNTTLRSSRPLVDAFPRGTAIVCLRHGPGIAGQEPRRRVGQDREAHGRAMWFGAGKTAE